jgi:hypothetical protein
MFKLIANRHEITINILIFEIFKVDKDIMLLFYHFLDLFMPINALNEKIFSLLMQAIFVEAFHSKRFVIFQ